MRLVPLVLLGVAIAAHAETRIAVDHNTGPATTPQFHFKNVPVPTRDDAAAGARAQPATPKQSPTTSAEPNPKDNRCLMSTSSHMPSQETPVIAGGELNSCSCPWANP